MALRSDDFKTSTQTTGPDPCERCQLTTCSSLHDYSASSCPYDLCQECRELGVMDAQIAEVHDLLIELSNKRRELKNRINLRHDRFTSQVPPEVFSYIFTFIADGTLSSIILLGTVCKQWREIILGTPQLWTKLSINFDVKCFPDMIALWGSRSGGLPLSLELNDGFHAPTPPNIVPLLRAQAHRCKDLTIRLRRAMPVLDMLLMGLEDALIVDSLKIHIYNTPPTDLVEITMKYPFAPERLDVNSVPLSHIPIQWDRLTHLTARAICADALIHIFQRARKLRYCYLSSVQDSTGHYPIPSSPVINLSIKHLELGHGGGNFDTHFLSRHLILPSLETLHYRLTSDSDDVGLVVDRIEEAWAATNLSAFLDHSHPPLHDFFVDHVDMAEQNRCDWYRRLPSINSIELQVWVDDSGERMQEYLQEFAVDVEPVNQALPCLRELKISSETMCLDSWNALARLFPDPIPDDDKDTSDSLVVPRPLKTVTIHTDMCWDLNEEIMPKATYTRLRAIQESGVVLQVFDENAIDVLGPDIELAFDDNEDEFENEGSEGLPED